MRKAALALSLLMAPVVAQAPGATLLQPADLRGVDRIVLDLAQSGRPRDAAQLAALLVTAGLTGKEREALDRQLTRIKPPKRDPRSRWPGIGRRLATVAERWAERLQTTTDAAARRRLAGLVLALDHRVAAAHEALGRVRLDGAWVTAEAHRLAARKSAVFAAMQKARTLDPAVTVEESRHELLLHVHGTPGHAVSCHGITIHTHWPAAKTGRLLQNLVRAIAFSKWLLHGGELALPPRLRHTSVLFTGKPRYLKAGRFDLANARSTKTEFERLAAYYRADGTLVNNRTSESHALAGILSHLTRVTSSELYGARFHPTLIVGHANWVLMAMFGTHLPGITYVEGKGPQGTSATPEDVELEMLFGAGLMGARSWLRYKVTRGEDPPWSRSFRDQVGKIDGVDMLKTTFVAEYMHLRGPLEPVLQSSRAGVGKTTPEIIASLESALGAPLHEFEARWRSWLAGVPDDTVSLVGRLGARTSGATETETQVLGALGRIRKAALTHPFLADVPPVTIDRVLSAQALLHAKYLNRHPDQMAKWPDAHEEYTDREGFTPEGCWAGMHSVIAPGVRSVDDAIDGWMGTFFHRLPLLHPGLFRVGYGQDGGTAVLDSGSMVRALDIDWQVAWPPAGMRDVPRRFSPELPSPYPGEDQAAWGYPITLQLGLPEVGGAPVVAMTLREGGKGGAVVDCRLSTPQDPGNPLLAPELAYCLIPKQHLKAGARYHVEAVIQAARKTTLAWTFTTSRR